MSTFAAAPLALLKFMLPHGWYWATTLVIPPAGPEGLHEAGRRGVLRRRAQEPQGRGSRRVRHPRGPPDGAGQAGRDRVERAQDHVDRVQEEEEEVEIGQ